MPADYEIVVSAENTAYLLWQCFVSYASCVETQGVAPSFVVHGDGPLLAGFQALVELGARVIRAPSYRMSRGGEYTARNTAGTLAEAAHDRSWTLVCDPDFLFLRPLRGRLDAIGTERAVSWDSVSYMRVDQQNRRWLTDACLERGIDPARLDSVGVGGVVPNLVPSALREEFAARWIGAVDTLVGLARRTGDVPWVTIAWGFALAAWELELELVLTELTATTLGGATEPESSLTHPILHYCYGDAMFDKRRHRGADSAARVWTLPARGSSVSAAFVRRLAAIRAWFQERGLDVTDVRLYTSAAGPRPARDDVRVEAVPRSCYLDALPLREASVGYGELGLNGDLGYEGKRVSVRGEAFPHALSVHAPGRLIFDIGGRYARFRSGVALNDDVSPGASYADFTVLADGRVVAARANVGPRAPAWIDAVVRGAKRLELRVDTTRWESCHTVWLDPRVEDDGSSSARDRTLIDALDRVEIRLPRVPLRSERCVATVVSRGYAELLDGLLESLRLNGNCPDARVVVFVADGDAACERVSAKHGAVVVPCSPRRPVNSTLKALLYSVAHVVDARQFLCLDVDMLVLGELSSIFAALEACPEGSLLACREGNGAYYRDLQHALTTVYGGRSGDIARIVGAEGSEGAYPLIVNDGLFAGDRTALLALDALIRGWPEAPAWTDELPDIRWRNQFVFNLAMAHLRRGVELKGTYNVQLHSQHVEIDGSNGSLRAAWRGLPVRVLHFNGSGRERYREWQGYFARRSSSDGVADPALP